MGGGKGGGSSTTNVTQRPLTTQELQLLSTQKDALNSGINIAKQQDERSAEQQNIWKQNYLPYEQQLGGMTTSSNARLGQLADNFTNLSSGLASQYATGLNNLASKYGTADADMLALARGQAYGNVSTSADTAQKTLQESLARRGVTGGAYNDALLRSEAQKQMALAGAGSQAYTNAIANSDTRRTAQGTALGQGYGAQSQALGAGLNAQSSGIQQQLGNMTNYANLGRGMAGMSQNYLGQAGQTYGQAAQTAGSTANGIGSNNTSYMGAQMNANAQAQAGKGAMTGSIIGAGSTLGAAAIMSDKRLKDNIVKIGELDNGLGIYRWDWNDTALSLGADEFPTFGVIAQEVESVMPDAVYLHKDGYLRVDYNMVMGV